MQCTVAFRLKQIAYSGHREGSGMYTMFLKGEGASWYFTIVPHSFMINR